MSKELTLQEDEVRVVHGMTKQRVEELTHILVHGLETDSYRTGAKKELHHLIYLQQKLDVHLQDIDQLRRENHE